jgi:trimeric autotransporter adhesin
MKTVAAQSKGSTRAMQALALVLMTLAVLLFAGRAAAVMAPANAVIGNQASATYVDSTATTRTSTSNTVQTTVAQVKSFLLTQSGARSVSPGQQVCYPHTITNTGNGADTYALNAPTTGGAFAHTGLAYFVDSDQNGSPDNGSAIVTSGSVAAGTSFNYVVCGTAPASATVGQQGTITVSATDTNAPTANTQSQIDTTTIAVASINVQKKLSSVPPPGYTPVASGASPNAGPLYVIFDYVNSGTVQADNLQINDVLPAGWLYVPGTGRWSGSGVTPMTDLAAGDPVGITYSAPTTAVSGTVASTIASVAGSSSGNLYFQVTIAPNLAVTTAGNQAATTNTATYQYSYTYFNPLTMTNQTINVASANTNSVLYSVLQVASVSANGSATSTGAAVGEPVTVASAGAGQTISWTDYIWNTGNGTDTFDIALVNAALNGTGCAVTNNAGLGQCTFPAGTTFQILAAGGATSLLDSNMNSAPDTGPIPPPVAGVCPAPYIASTSMPVHCGLPIVISATLPVAAPTGNNGGAGYQVLVSATSSFNNLTSETVPNVLATIAASTVDLTNNLSVVGGATIANGLGPDNAAVITNNTVTPAVATTTTTRFQLYVNNTSTVAQIYNVSGTFVSVPGGVGLAAQPAGWTIVFRDDGGAGNCSTVAGTVTSTGATPIAAGSSKLICAEITVPATSSSAVGTPTLAPAGNYVVQFRSEQQSDATVFDTKRDQVTIQAVHSVTVTPNGAQSTVPGGAVTYVHSVTNTGNVSENITFPTLAFLTNSQSPAYAWSATAYIDSNNNGVLDIGTDAVIVAGTTTFVLPPNSSQTVFVRVNAPAMAGSPPNVTNLTVTYNAGANTASASDTTSLTDGLRLDKFQQLPGATGSCVIAPATTLTGSVPNAPWSGAAIAAGPNTVPGRCIAYLIVGTNTTATNVTNISVSDLVPANTTLETGCGAPAVTGPIALTGGPYATSYTGSVTAASSPLATTPLPPGGTFTLQFCVKINDV